MKNKPPNWYVDNIWTCGCGSLNAAYLKKCGGCKKKRNEKRISHHNEITFNGAYLHH